MVIEDFAIEQCTRMRERHFFEWFNKKIALSKFKYGAINQQDCSFYILEKLLREVNDYRESIQYYRIQAIDAILKDLE